MGADGTAYAAASFSSYLRARSYDPTLGRFLSRDSWPGSSSAPQTLDRYTYVADNPTTRSDPSGHCFVDTIADVGFLAWDVISLASGPPKERETNLAALGADLIGAALPCATGLGLAVRGSIRWVGHGTKILEGPKAIRSAAKIFGVEFEKPNNYIHRELKGDLLGPADNVRIMPNGDIVPPRGDEILGNVYDVLE